MKDIRYTVDFVSRLVLQKYKIVSIVGLFIVCDVSIIAKIKM